VKFYATLSVFEKSFLDIISPGSIQQYKLQLDTMVVVSIFSKDIITDHVM